MGGCGRGAVLLLTLVLGGCEAIFGVPSPTLVGDAGAATVELRVSIAGSAGLAGLPVRVRGPGGLDCPGQCSYAAPLGADVSFTATTLEGARFRGWRGVGTDCGDAPMCVVRASQAGELIARWDLPANVAFVSSRVYSADFGASGDPHAFADGECDDLASAADLPPGPYVAWISTIAEPALTHLGTQASGWVRPDGAPFARDVAALLDGRILYPARLDEGGADVGSEAVVLTGTSPNGLQVDNCRDWTRLQAPGGGGFEAMAAGEAGGSTAVWTIGRDVGVLCNRKGHLLCLGRGASDAPPTLPAPFTAVPAIDSPLARLWLSQATLTPGAGGLGRAFTLCQTEGQSTHALPLLAAGGVTAGQQVLRDPGTAAPVTFVRPDGVVVAASFHDLAEGRLLAAPNVTLDGQELGPEAPVWLGSASLDADATGTCADWSSTAESGLAAVVATTSPRGAATACGGGLRVLCVDFPTRLF